jgi:hypothetical protein
MSVQDESFRWWAVDCQTEDCKTKLLLDCIGPNDASTRAYRVYMLKQCAPFKETCPDCKVEHEYSLIDVHQVDFEAPPSDYRPSPAFVKAIQPPEP